MASSLVELRSPLTGPGTTPCPVDLPAIPGVDISARYHSDRCAGDFFDAQMVGSRLVFLLTDIAGSRAEAHAIAAQAQAIFRQRAWELFEPADANESDSIAALAHDVNRTLMDAANGVRLAPTFLACFNVDLGILTYCNAGTVLAIFKDARSVQRLERGGVPLGLFTHVTYEPAVLAFERGDRLMIVSKGVTGNQKGGAKFGFRRIDRILSQTSKESAARICDVVLREAFQFKKRPLSRLYNIFRPRTQSTREDMTAVTLVRR
jgi:serine phosphatase RsbU (regulator of sigma subunit)